MNRDLFRYVANLPAVDAHEHLRPEEVRLGKKPDVLWLFHQYANSALQSAGMAEADVRAVMDTEGPLDARWKRFKPFFERIRHTGPALAVLYALKDLYGVDTLDDRTYRAASERILAENTPGLVDRFLHQKGRITAILNHNYQLDQPSSRCHAVMYLGHLAQPKDVEQIRNLEKEQRVSITDVESYLAGVDRQLETYRGRGVVALKFVSLPWRAGSRRAAQTAFQKLRKNRKLAAHEREGLDHYLFQEILKLVPRHDFTVAVHCGYYAGVNQDFSASHVRHVIPVLQRNPAVRFDLFHLSYPWIEEAIAIGQAFTNVTLNLTWCAIINPLATERAMMELVNTVPHNKVLAMGGDYWELPDVAYGHLRLARELLARSLSNCVADERIAVEEAKDIARLWLSDNARQIYPLLPSREGGA